MEKVEICYNCGSREHSLFATENGFSLVRCHDCGLLFVDSRPSETQIAVAHQQGLHNGVQTVEVTGRFLPRKVERLRSVLKDLCVPRGERTWLDVGCGHGEFLEALQLYNPEAIVRGTEPNLHKQASGRARGLNIDYFDLATHGEYYDSISLLNVFSHLSDPPSFIGLLRERLNSGGEIILETGDTKGLAPDELFRPLYLPDHLSFATEEIVQGLLSRSGFRVLEVRKYSYLDTTFRGFTWEVLKSLFPQRRSLIKYYFKPLGYRRSDMFFRAVRR
jgi:SAM-dependent methyltransferase